jgi:hypothetical protein
VRQSAAKASPFMPAASSSARASASVFPVMSASVWAKKFASSKVWCSPMGLWVSMEARKSLGTSFVPWCRSW